MANEISLVTASGRTVTPKDDGIIYEVFSPGNGIIYGGAVTIKDSSTLHITAGHGIVCGRKFTIDNSDIPVALSGSGSLLGRLYIHLDLADAADPITLLVETGESLTPVVQDADVNINNGVFEINIATFDVDTTTISNLVNLDVTVAPMGDMEGATAGTDGKGGYVPAPQAGDEDKVLKGDGTWGTAGDTASVRYDPDTGYIQYTTDGGTTWVNLINTSTPQQLLPVMTNNDSPVGTVWSEGENLAYKAIDGSWDGVGTPYISLTSSGTLIRFTFNTVTFVKYLKITAKILYGSDHNFAFEYTKDGSTWHNAGSYLPTSGNWEEFTSDNINDTVLAIRVRRTAGTGGNLYVYKFEAWG